MELLLLLMVVAEAEDARWTDIFVVGCDDTWCKGVEDADGEDDDLFVRRVVIERVEAIIVVSRPGEEEEEEEEDDRKAIGS